MKKAHQVTQIQPVSADKAVMGKRIVRILLVVLRAPKVSYGHGVHHLDMKEMISVYGAPEFQLARVMAAEMGRFYCLPVWGYAAHSDSASLDEQAAIDAQFSIQTGQGYAHPCAGSNSGAP